MKGTGEAGMAAAKASMVDAWARYHLARRKYTLARKLWLTEGATHLPALNAYYDALEAARRANPAFERMDEELQRALVGAAVMDRGVAAEQACAKGNKRLHDLESGCRVELEQALYLMGMFHGLGMACDESGPVARTYWRHARRMAKTLRQNMPHARTVGLLEDFQSAAGWAKAMGLRSGKALVEMLSKSKVASPCALAGR